jgi:hypothetical protein
MKIYSFVGPSLSIVDEWNVINLRSSKEMCARAISTRIWPPFFCSHCINITICLSYGSKLITKISSPLCNIFKKKNCPSEVPTQKKSFFNLHNQEIVHKDFSDLWTNVRWYFHWWFVHLSLSRLAIIVLQYLRASFVLLPQQYRVHVYCLGTP